VSGICGYTWSLCAKRSGLGHSNPHLCGEAPGHLKAHDPHRCTACSETT
jgi:hypothetical protein